MDLINKQYTKLTELLKYEFEMKHRFLNLKRIHQRICIDSFEENKYEVLLNKINFV
jgi:hypothetical protein